MKRIAVNTVIIFCVCLLGYYCYTAGKSYKVLLENLPYTIAGEEHPGIEAMQIRIDNAGEPVLLLDGDRINVTAVGKKHVLTVEILDEEDKVLETKEFPFSVRELGDPPTLNVAKAFAEGGVIAEEQSK